VCVSVLCDLRVCNLSVVLSLCVSIINWNVDVRIRSDLMEIYNSS
jgi:hypothetical protein